MDVVYCIVSAECARKATARVLALDVGYFPLRYEAHLVPLAECIAEGCSNALMAFPLLSGPISGQYSKMTFFSTQANLGLFWWK